jgi:S-adenosylmethionine hydrolase
MNWITLTTDFTEHDGYVGVMKGVIAGIAPQARIIDLSHMVAPQDVFQAALLLGRSVPYFPAGTVHVAVVDPGVGTARRGIAAWRRSAAPFTGATSSPRPGRTWPPARRWKASARPS